MRTGTSWIQAYLAGRGDICPPKGVKETFFFDRQFGKGLAWYEAHFRHYDPKRHARTVEVAPSYFHCPEAPERIARTLSRPRLVVVVRDPVERSISHYRHIRSLGLTKRPILEAVEAFPELTEASRYAALLDRWEGVLGTGAVQLLFQDQLKVSPLEFVRSLTQAIGVPYADPTEGLRNARLNSTGDPPIFWLARAAWKVACSLRARRLHGVVEVAKAVGLKRVFLGSDRSTRKVIITEEDRQALRTILAADWEDMKRRLRSCSYSNFVPSSRGL